MLSNCTQAMGLNESEIQSIQAAWHTTEVTAKAVSVAAGGYSWPLLYGSNSPINTSPVECRNYFLEAMNYLELS